MNLQLKFFFSFAISRFFFFLYILKHWFVKLIILCVSLKLTWLDLTEKIRGLCQQYQRWIYSWPEGFIPWLINLQLFAHTLIKWLPGECADSFFDITMTWLYCLHRRYSMSRQKNSILINALNREPVSLNKLIFMVKPIITHVLHID